MLLLPVLAHLSDGVCHVELLENGVHVASGSSVLQTDIATHCMEAYKQTYALMYCLVNMSE